jgi:hypothetical protein
MRLRKLTFFPNATSKINVFPDWASAKTRVFGNPGAAKKMGFWVKKSDDSPDQLPVDHLGREAAVPHPYGLFQALPVVERLHEVVREPLALPAPLEPGDVAGALPLLGEDMHMGVPRLALVDPAGPVTVIVGFTGLNGLDDDTAGRDCYRAHGLKRAMRPRVFGFA